MASAEEAAGALMPGDMVLIATRPVPASISDMLPGGAGGRHVLHVYYASVADEEGGGATGSAGPAPAASVEAIDTLKDVAANDVVDHDCSICLDQPAAAAWKEMPCGHRFHGGCLQKWLCGHATCPLCRHQMPTASAAAAVGTSPPPRRLLYFEVVPEVAAASDDSMDEDDID